MLHLLDASAENVIENYHTVRGELEAYGDELLHKPEIVALSKVDLLDAKALRKVRKSVEDALGTSVLTLSSATREGWMKRSRPCTARFWNSAPMKPNAR